MTATEVPLPSLAHDEEGGAAPAVDVGRPVRDSLVFLVGTYALGVALALAIPGTVENPGPVSGLTALIPALVVGIVRLVARRRKAPANPFPLGMRRLARRSVGAATCCPALPA